MAHACFFDHLVGQRHVPFVIRRQISNDIRPGPAVLHHVTITETE